MKFKRFLAREWLIFLLFILWSPVVYACYVWVSTADSENKLYADVDLFDYEKSYEDKVAEAKARREYEELQRTPRDPSKRRDIFDEVAEEALKKQVEEGAWRVPKKSFIQYLWLKMRQPPSYLVIIYFYPVYLLLCSILWAVRALRKSAIEP